MNNIYKYVDGNKISTKDYFFLLAKYVGTAGNEC